MPRRNRLPYAALRGCLIGAFFWSSTVLGQTGNPKSKIPDNQPAAEQAAPVKPAEAAAGLKKPDTPEQAKNLCDKPQTPEERDLCQQWRMAEAAEKQAKWTRRQVWITVAEVLGLLAVVVLTVVTARAANRSAKAAEAVVKETRKTAECQLRAYVHPSKIAIKLSEDGMATATIPLENTGQTPAYQLTCWTTIAVAPYPLNFELPIVPVDPNQSSSTVLRAGGTTTTKISLSNPPTLEEREMITTAKAAIYVYGHAKNRDVFDKKHTTKFRFMYHGLWGGTQALSVCQEGNEAD